MSPTTAHEPTNAKKSVGKDVAVRAGAGDDEVNAKASLAVSLPTLRCTLGSNEVLVAVSQPLEPAVMGLASV